jgi:hypothetical protein
VVSIGGAVPSPAAEERNAHCAVTTVDSGHVAVDWRASATTR